MTNNSEWFIRCIDTNLITDLDCCKGCDNCSNIEDVEVPITAGEKIIIGKTVACKYNGVLSQLGAINVCDEEALSDL